MRVIERNVLLVMVGLLFAAIAWAGVVGRGGLFAYLGIIIGWIVAIKADRRRGLWVAFLGTLMVTVSVL